jgi:hypothetical protein
MKKEDYFQIMSNSDVKLKCPSLYTFDNKSKSKAKAPIVVNMCSQGGGGVADAETSSSSSSQQSTVSGPPPTRFTSSGIGLAKENSSCEIDNRKQQESRKVCISPYYCMADILRFSLWKMLLHVLVLGAVGFQILYHFQVDICKNCCYSSLK